MKNILAKLFLVVLLCFSLVGWYVLLSQKVDILVLARWRYLQALNKKTDMTSGPCLGTIKTDWVLDIAHLPRESVDNLPENQCGDYLLGKAHHFVEMTDRGEIIIVN